MQPWAAKLNHLRHDVPKKGGVYEDKDFSSIAGTDDDHGWDRNGQHPGGHRQTRRAARGRAVRRSPYAFVDKNGEHTGSMVDFAKDMADRMGVKLKILDFDWDGLIPALLSGKADVLAADMTPTLKRHLKISFCDPWYYVQPAVFTKTESTFGKIADVDKPT
jgi:hypothetical protein